MLTFILTITGITMATICGVVSAAYACVFLVLYAENRRFWQTRHREAAPSVDVYPKCLLIVPCKGLEHKLRENLAGFLRQDHPNYEVAFVVEDGRDAAIPLIRELMKEHGFVKSRLVIAGRSDISGQKVENLRAATKDLQNEIEVIVFADSDAGSKATWLRWLVVGIGREGLGARTGYRWMTPIDDKLATLVACSINNAVAAMFGNGKHFLVWGGSWAIHRRIFDSIALRESWTGTLSDDLIASRILRFSRLGIAFEPQCVCTSYVSFSWSGLFEFLSRQLIIGRIYATSYWMTAAFVTLASQIGFWGSLIGGASMLAGGNAHGYWLLLFTACLYTAGVARGALRQSMGRQVCPEWRVARKARHFDVWAGPLNGLVLSIIFIRSMFGRKILWRGIGYHIGQGGRIQMLGRRISRHPWPINTSVASKTPPEGRENDHTADRRKSA